MATPVQTANAQGWSWRRPTKVLRAAPPALVWTVTLALAWAVLRPPLTLLAGMVRWQPRGSEGLYLAGVGVGLAIDLVVYGFLLAFLLLRRERWAQVSLIALSLVQTLYWGSLLARSHHGYAPVPANYPAFANPPLLPVDVMYGVSIALTALAALAASSPGVWRWTRRADRAANA